MRSSSNPYNTQKPLLEGSFPVCNLHLVFVLTFMGYPAIPKLVMMGTFRLQDIWGRFFWFWKISLSSNFLQWILWILRSLGLKNTIKYGKDIWKGEMKKIETLAKFLFVYNIEPPFLGYLETRFLETWSIPNYMI